MKLSQKIAPTLVLVEFAMSQRRLQLHMMWQRSFVIFWVLLKLIEGFLTPVLHSDMRTWAVNYVLIHFSWDVPCWMPLSRGTIVKNMLQQKSSKLGHWMIHDQSMRDKHFPVQNQSLMPTSQAIALGPSIIRFTGTAGSCINFFPEWNFMLDFARHNCIANTRFCYKPFFPPSLV